MPLTPEQRVIRARIAARTRWSKEDPKPNAAVGQRGLRAKFLRDIAAAHPELDDAEIARRAESAYIAHMTRLSFAASKARTAKAAIA